MNTYEATNPFNGEIATFTTRRDIGFAVFTFTAGGAPCHKFAKTQDAAWRVWGRNPNRFMPRTRIVVKARKVAA